MSEQNQTQTSRWRIFAGGVVVLFSFAILAALAIAIGGGEDPIERKELGEFTEETINQRWANREEVSKAQSDLVDSEKVAASMKKVISEAKGKKASKTELLVPGSPTFLKQAAAEAAKAAPPEEGEKAAPKTDEETKPAEGGEEKAKAGDKPAEPETPKPADKPKGGQEKGKKKGEGDKKGNPAKGKGNGKGKVKA